MILDVITSSPINVFVTIVIGIGIAYLYYRKPSSSSQSSSSSRSFGSSRNTIQPGYSRSIGGFGGGLVDAELQRTIAQIERQERDMIRQEQDEAYQMSLKADREKQMRREEELRDKEAEEKAQRERHAKQEQLHRTLVKLKGEICSQLPKEPSPEHEKDSIVKLVFKLPDGTRVKRIFFKSDKVKYLYWYVFSLSNAPLQFKMTTNFPKRDLPGRPPRPEDFNDMSRTEKDFSEPNCEQTLEEASLTETQIIFVYDLEA